MSIRVGCCGFPKAKATYYQHFFLVEVQQTFYQPPRLETARRWREEAPPDFEFTVKAWQLITHQPTSPTYRRLREPIPPKRRDRYGAFRPTDEVFAAWERTREIAQALKARVVLFQCPASFIPIPENIANMRAFFRAVEREGLIFVWEPRGAWPDDVVAKLCRELDLVHGVDPFHRQPVTRETAYFRLHGITGYRYRFSDDDLHRLLDWCKPFSEVYCLFNNVSMWDDAQRMQELCKVI